VDFFSLRDQRFYFQPYSFPNAAAVSVGFILEASFFDLMDEPLRSAVRLGPKAIATLDGVGVVAQTRVGRNFLEQFGIPSAEHHVVRLHCVLELLDKDAR
jgi:hypothetical protein